jgi:K+/H+ antiporter YhaU regulatory subunit KhtT
VDEDKESRAIFRQNTQEFTSSEQSAALSKDRLKQQAELLDKKSKYEDRVSKALSLIHSKIIKYDSKSGFAGRSMVSLKPLKESNKI